MSATQMGSTSFGYLSHLTELVLWRLGTMSKFVMKSSIFGVEGITIWDIVLPVLPRRGQAPNEMGTQGFGIKLSWEIKTVGTIMNSMSNRLLILFWFIVTACVGVTIPLTNTPQVVHPMPPGPPF